VSEPVIADTSGRLPTPAALEAIAVDAAAAGAEVIRAAAGRSDVIGTKSTPTDPVTALNIAVEQTIRDHIQRLTPGAGFLGEEEGRRAGASTLGWILDPIDGTVNLTYRIPLLAVSLAATISGRVVAGVVIDPWREEVFSASRGRGARVGGSPIVTSTVQRLSEALVGPVSRTPRTAGRGRPRPSGGSCRRPATCAASDRRLCTCAGWPTADSTPTTSATCRPGTTPRAR